MEYDIKSKPTVYNGTKYRSRLEARWAAMFDLLGWRFQYEPYDLNGWTPDFAIYGSENRVLFLEVKPIVTKEYAKEYSVKIRNISPTVNAVMISTDFKEDGFGGPILAGYQIGHKESNYYGLDGEFLEAFEVHWKNQQCGIGSEYDIGSEYMAFDGMLWHSVDQRKHFLSHFRDDFKVFNEKWIEAGERTRFHYHG